MYYFATPVFQSQSLSSASASLTSSQIDIGDISHLCFQCVTSVTTADLSFQLQLSNEEFSRPATLSNWINEGTANPVLETSKLSFASMGAQKARVVMTWNAGAAALSVELVGKSLQT